MKSILATLNKDRTALAGLFMLALSLAIFTGTANVYETNFDLFGATFFVCYLLTFIYFIIVVFEKKEQTNRFWGFYSFRRNVILLQLLNVSAYALNRSLPVFQISTNWVVAFLLISNLFLVLHILWEEKRPQWLDAIVLLVSGMGMCFHLYENFYVGTLYPITLLSFWFFGISLHTFVPLLFFSVFFKISRIFLLQSPNYWKYTAIGVAIPLLFLGYITTRFQGVQNKIETSFHTTNSPQHDSSLPDWVHLSQNLKRDGITKRALKSGLTFTDANYLSWSDFPMDNRINERIKHDPFVVLATSITGEIDLKNEDKIQVLRALFDERHTTERKFWSGDNLSTTDIVTNVQLFPDYRLAYTEKTFKIKNSQVERWQRQQEALYTFYLPEGSVVTSSSLWVNGEESPAYLTTKQKADSAYARIVGRERRDPLLLHWQEGNRVTVRIFPCTPDEDRQFKIGVSTPMRLEGEELVYENIDFEGPYYKNAHESINVIINGSFTKLETPFSFSQEGNSYSYTGKYDSRWTLRCDAPPLSEGVFSFNERSFQLKELQNNVEKIDATKIYLDINRAWSSREITSLWNALQLDHELYVYTYKLERLTATNKDDLVDYLQTKNFTLFPFHKIDAPNKAIVISKYSQLTPTLDDLEKSPFLKDLSSFFQAQNDPIRVFNLTTEISPYLKSLKELRCIQLENKEAVSIANLIQKDEFPALAETTSAVANQYAKVYIQEIPYNATTQVTAPDHLMRLFSYNALMRKIGKDYFNKKEREHEWIREAEEAYVVTPISSMLVLESQADYDRFDLKKSKNSLQNASMNDAGSVPEPHEWLLIILVASILGYLTWRRRLQLQNA